MLQSREYVTVSVRERIEEVLPLPKSPRAVHTSLGFVMIYEVG
jgi:hypothetical protein